MHDNLKKVCVVKPITMKAVLAKGSKEVKYTADYTKPSIAAGDVLVRRVTDIPISTDMLKSRLMRYAIRDKGIARKTAMSKSTVERRTKVYVPTEGYTGPRVIPVVFLSRHSAGSK